MKVRLRLAVLATALGIAAAAAGAGWAQDAPSVVKQRQDVMEKQSRNLAAVKAFLDGKADLAAAQAAAAELTRTTSSIPNLFPQGTSNAEFPGKTRQAGYLGAVGSVYR